MTTQKIKIMAVEDCPADKRRGGDLRTLLSPRTVGSTSGFMGIGTIPVGDYIAEHYHPYSEMFIYVVSGNVLARLDGEHHELPARHGVMIPPNVKYRLANNGAEDAFIVWHAGPLAPRPELGHVDTETHE